MCQVLKLFNIKCYYLLDTHAVTLNSLGSVFPLPMPAWLVNITSLYPCVSNSFKCFGICLKAICQSSLFFAKTRPDFVLISVPSRS